jgi:hypothetical protein
MEVQSFLCRSSRRKRGGTRLNRDLGGSLTKEYDFEGEHPGNQQRKRPQGALGHPHVGMPHVACVASGLPAYLLERARGVSCERQGLGITCIQTNHGHLRKLGENGERIQTHSGSVSRLICKTSPLAAHCINSRAKPMPASSFRPCKVGKGWKKM